MTSGDTEDEAVRAVATNNWVADTIHSDTEGLTKKSAVELLKRLEANFDRVCHAKSLYLELCIKSVLSWPSLCMQIFLWQVR